MVRFLLSVALAFTLPQYLVSGFILNYQGHSSHSSTTCRKYTYSDGACYYEINQSTGKYQITACKTGTQFHTYSCDCGVYYGLHHTRTPDCLAALRNGPITLGGSSANNQSSNGHSSSGSSHGQSFTSHNGHLYQAVNVDYCLQITEYKEIIDLIHRDNCAAAGKVWLHLQKLVNASSLCAHSLVTNLAAQYSQSPWDCHCPTDNNRKLKYEHHADGYYDYCGKDDTNYVKIRNQIIGNNPAHHGFSDHYGRYGVCQTHHTLWKTLKQWTSNEAPLNTYDCLKYIVNHLSYTIQRQEYPCTCSSRAGRHTLPITTTTTTTTTTTLSTTTTETTKPSTIVPFKGFNCDKIQTIKALSLHSKLTSNGSSTCPDISDVSPEVVPINFCNTPLHETWKAGLNVLKHCESIPKYTAIATFIGGTYLTDGLSGVLIDCNSTSITIVAQECAKPINVYQLTIGTQRDHFYKMPDIYFTIAP